MGGMRVAYTLEQCWHDAPGGTAVAALEVARRLAPRSDVTLVGVAGRHRSRTAAGVAVADPGRPAPAAPPAALRVVAAAAPPARRAGHRAASTSPTPPASCRARPAAPLVVTMHDLAFLDDPSRFTRQGLRVMRRSLDVTRDRAALVITSSEASRRDLEANGVEAARIRVVPLGVDHAPASSDDDRRGARALRACPRGSCSSSARSSRARTSAASPRRPASCWRCRSSSPARTVGATPPPASPATCASSASCRPPTCRRCTPRRPCSPTRASRRASACRCSRRWPRARPSSRAPARRPRRSPAAPPCSSTRSTSTRSPPASTTPSAAPPSCRRPAAPGRRR